MDMSGRVAVVTGAGRGIGRELAVLFASLGASVVVAEIIGEAGEETVRLIKDRRGKAVFIPTDVSDAASVAELARGVSATFGPADVLVNNAILSPVASVEETDIELWDRVTAVNLRGTFLCCKAFLPEMRRAGRGVMVNMTSADAMPFMSAYMATKQGIAGFTRSLDAELEGSGGGSIRAVAFVPGVVDTPGLRAAMSKLAPSLGMSAEEFFQSAMTAERAALATAHLILEFAEEYHGEVVDGYTILERIEGAKGADRAIAVAPGATVSASVDAAKAAQTLQAILAETQAELNKLPIFVRPMARAGFKDKAGLSMKDWGLKAQELSEQFAAAAGGTAAGEGQGLHAEFIRRLPQLASYYHAVPAQTARFSRDQEFLALVRQTSEERERAAEMLRQALIALSQV